jgi:hypothetical protein
MNIDPATERQFTDLGWALVAVFAMRIGAVFSLPRFALVTLIVRTRRRRRNDRCAWISVLGCVAASVAIGHPSGPGAMRVRVHGRQLVTTSSNVTNVRNRMR